MVYSLRPQQVLEADPDYSNSNDDLTRALPESSDPEFELFGVELVDIETTGSSGVFSEFEKIIGGEVVQQSF